MKNYLILLFAFSMLFSCQKRYTTSSPEIDIAKKHLEAYENGDWEVWKEQYTDSSKIYHNNWDVALTSTQALKGHQLIISYLNFYEYVDEPIFFEMIVDDDGKKWVNFWGVWHGIMANTETEIKVPVHLSINYENGKVVEEYGFWDTSKLIEALDESDLEQPEIVSIE
ncbi:hypothetical protein EC396_08085 [Lutibacter sp. HS1-25]|uniref:nuclear transport factor 2 family protein n=1 Tax=Lutibacter sp. HS1-25 TaxID=2485000 RepID=UPI0010117782|nr:hypothetical protein [Lutibacter sp. HS1-25]RXP55780.1 hypothetical protein EC396_08085 [Lutibacter sp. HS1-25]